MRDDARAVVIGGGVGGCSILYHLAKLGWKDVVLVEQYGLTHGSTWHSAGLVGQLRSTVSLTKMMQYSVGLYADLARETGKDPGWHELGGLRLASSQERYEEIQRQAGWAKSFGLPIEIVSPAEAKELFPPMSTDGVVAAAFLPQDGYLDPSQLTFALADGARRLGAEIEQRTRVLDVIVEGGRCRGVVTDKGTIRADVVVNAGGMYAPQIGRMAGVEVPIIPYAHEFLVTEAFDPPLEPLPTLRDPDRLIYFRDRGGRPDHGRLRAKPGGVGARRRPRRLRGAAPARGLGALRRAAGELGRAGAGDGDGRGAKALQRPRGVHAGRRVHPRRVATCRGSGSRPGSARTAWPAPAAWAGRWPSGSSNGEPSSTCGTWTSAASAASTAARPHARPRDRGVLDLLRHQVPQPGARRPAGRCGSRRPTPRLAALGAVFGEKSGWERPNWFEPNAARGRRGAAAARLGGRALVAGDRRRVGRDPRAAPGSSTRRSFAKIEVSGPGAVAFLQRLCANDVDRPVGSVTYTQMLNDARRDRVRLHRDPARPTTGS